MYDLQQVIALFIALDTGIENKQEILTQSKLNVSSVYKWIIDGMSKHNIINHLQQMTMSANAYTTQIGTPNWAIAEILIAGYYGQLKGWVGSPSNSWRPPWYLIFSKMIHIRVNNYYL